MTVRFDPTKVKVQFLPQFYYYEGNCNDEEAQKQIKSNFLNLLRTGMLAGMGHACANQAICNAENVNVFCGETDKRKRRRRAVVKEVYIQVKRPCSVFTRVALANKPVAFHQ